MVKTLILTSRNIVANTSNSVFQYDFPLGGVTFKDDFIAVQQISLYNSVFNISSANNNNTFNYTWVDGSVVNVTIPDSYLSLEGINQYLQSIMITNKHYLTTTTGDNVYLLELVVNPSKYAYQLNSYVISATLASTNSWSLPAGATWVLPTNLICPIFTVPNTSFQTLIGYSAGNYPNATISGTPPAQTQTPAYTSAQSFLSTTAPQIIVQPNFLCICSLVNNRFAIPSQLLTTITPVGVGFGELFVQQFNDLAYNRIENGVYNNFTFRFVDTLGNPIQFQDPNIVILLNIKNRDEVL
jgi:hypothetical protein